MSPKCAIKLVFTSIILIVIVNGFAKNISRDEKGRNRLNEYISHYETLNYDPELIKASHRRARRSVTKDHILRLTFSAHGRNFHLRLKRDVSTFNDNLEILDSRNKPIEVSTDHIYEGEVVGDRGSYVFGSILDGVFEGKIITERDAYYVEHAKRYFPLNLTQRIALERTADEKQKYYNNYTMSTSTFSNQDTATANTRKIYRQTNSDTTSNVTWTKNIVSSNASDNDSEHDIDKISDVQFHSVIYKDSHVEDAYKHLREGHVGGCGITEEVSQWMENIQNSAVEELPVPMSKNDAKMFPTAHDNLKNADLSTKNIDNNEKLNNKRPQKKYANGASDDFMYPYEKYTREANFRFADDEITDVRKIIEQAASLPRQKHMEQNFEDFQTDVMSENKKRYYATSDDNWHERVHERMRRASGTGSGSSRREDNRNTCSLYIQTDPLIWRHIREGIAVHDRKYEIDVKTREEITSLIAHHVTAVNYIYRNTKFDGRSEHRNIRFEVQRIKIDDDSACRNNYNGPHNAFCNEHMDVSNFLNLHSLEDHSDFCLAYVFTYRDFTGGTLGLAWVASASGASGGICEKYKTYTETVGGQYQSTKRSLNTGIITFVNYNSRVPPKVSQLTLAHEIGHNFGSPHDYPQECRPGGLNGNFIMFASATSGDRPNNSKFSPCSIRNISNVLDVLVGNTKRDCFKASEGAFCGNKIVESGEECDCGFNEEECKDNCCYPRIISEYDMSLNSSAHGCRRRAKTQCSPSEGPCCLANSCTFVPFKYQQKCKEQTECSWFSYCNGTSAECPKAKPRENNTKCNNGTALCNDGECSGSICKLWNMSECFLNSQSAPQLDKRKLCELACQNGNDTSTCRSTSEFAHLYGLPEGGISLRPGSPCDNFQGYCDVFLKCRAVDADGPLVRLKNLLLNRETLLTVAQWVTENWYIVVLIGIGFIIVMGIFIKCCAVHTPSSNPKKRRARRISETLRAPMNTLRRMRHYSHGRGAGMTRGVPASGHSYSGHGHHHRNGPGGVVSASRHHASDRSSGGGGAGQSSRATSSGRSQSVITNNSRNAGQGYSDNSPTVGVDLGAALGATSTAGRGGFSRAQMPLPLPPGVQQQHALAASYTTPKDIPRNKFRSSRASISETKLQQNRASKKDTQCPQHRSETKKTEKTRRNIVY